MKKVFDVGINDYEGKVKISGKKIKSYQVWQSMLRRCYDKKFQEKQPTYIGCSVCDEWKYFSNFKSWFDKNYRYDLEELGLKPSLDKDLLIEGNKVYSPSTCVFLPHRINSFLANIYATNTSSAVGVSWHKHNNKWVVQIKDFDTHKRKNLGYFTSIEQAKECYIKAREIEALKAQEYMRDLGYSEDVVSKIR